MKKILTILLLLVSVKVIAQTYPITSITISLPANPDANTANWGSGTSLFTITANSKAINGKVDGHVIESKILVTIKKGGAKACGSFTANTAPASNFNTLTKVWSGNNAVSLLGQSCVLPAGEYELTVQFFGPGTTGLAPLSEEKTKPFSIRAKEQLSYQPPQAIAPANGTVLSEIDIKKPITFRWTPVIPRPQEPVTYRLKGWQLMQGQNGAQAMATNQPIITKDVDNLTQTMVTNLVTGPCMAPYLCYYMWNVQALNREGKPVGGNNGMSEALKFNVQAVNEAPSKIALVFPANASTISAKDKPKFTWKHEKQNTETSDSDTYKIRIVEIIGDQSPEVALKTNKPHFEKDNLKEQSFQYPSSAPSFIAGKKYGWNVSIFDRWGNQISSTSSMFFASTCDVNLILKLRSVECLPDSGRNKRFNIGVFATYTSAVYNLTYTNSGSGFKAYHPSYTPNYSIANISPSLQVQNSGLTTTKTYFLEVSVPAGQTAIKVGLQGDDKDPGPIVCQPGAELDVQLPICDVGCKCGTWSKLAVQNAAGIKRYDCGSTIKWSCKTPFQFTSSYQCSPNDKTCEAKTTWEVKKGTTVIKSGTGTNTLSDGFSLMANGTYTLTLNANCGDKACPPCIYTIVIEDCKDADPCKDVLLCNTDFEQFVNISPPTTFVQTSQDNIPCWKTTATDSNIEIWKSGFGGVSAAYSGNYFAELNATQVGILSQTFTATGPITVSVSFAHRGRYAGYDKMQVSIVSPGGTSTLLGNYSANSTGWILNVSPPYTIPSTALGIYTLEFRSISSNNGDGPGNGGNFLDAITVTCTEAPPVCDCGTWNPLAVQNAAGIKRYDCGSTIKWSCKTPFQFTSSYQCSPNDKTCEAKTTWEVKKGTTVIKSGTGTNQLNDGFSLLENGTSTLTLNAECNGKKCPPCIYTIIVEDCNLVGSICGMKFNDLNGNGLKDKDEPGIPGWVINLVGSVDLSTKTDEKGNYCFADLKPGEYTIKEEIQPNWMQTEPSLGHFEVKLKEGQNIRDRDFGNRFDVCTSGTKAWSPLGTGVNGKLYAIAHIGTDIYVGGTFTMAGGIPAKNIAKWNGTSWSALGLGVGGFPDNTVRAICAVGTDLYVGGGFNLAGGVTANCIAKWNGTTWSTLGTVVNGLNGVVDEIKMIGNDLYVGGHFTTAGGITVNNIAKWNGTSWTALAGGLNVGVRAIAEFNGMIYAGGFSFSTSGNNFTSSLNKWNGSSWSKAGMHMGTFFPWQAVDALLVIGPDLYVGGWFGMPYGWHGIKSFAKWNGITWSSVGSGININGHLDALVTIGTDIYASGDFNIASGASLIGIAKWNGTNWSGLGSGIPGHVEAMTVVGADLYAVGSFTSAGGVNANYVAKYSCVVPIDVKKVDENKK